LKEEEHFLLKQEKMNKKLKRGRVMFFSSDLVLFQRIFFEALNNFIRNCTEKY